MKHNIIEGEVIQTVLFGPILQNQHEQFGSLAVNHDIAPM